jgi:chloramphenicol 3-O-phosphotransferase
MASGKTTVGRILAERFERGVYVEGDIFRRSIVRGRADMTPAASDEALSQLRLRYQLAAAAADGYFDAGFSVVLEDVIAGRILDDVVGFIRGRPLHVVVLLPSADAIAEREQGRANRGYGHYSIEALRNAFVEDTPRIGLWLDTSAQAPVESVDEILNAIALGHAAVHQS